MQSTAACATTLSIDTLPAVTPPGRIILVGDVHGCLDQLNALLVKARFNRHEDVLVLVGDLVNKGPNSVGVVRRVMELGAHCVLGNHDAALVAHCARIRAGEVDPTEPPHCDDPMTATALELPEECRRFLASLPHMIKIPQYDVVVAHAGLNPTRALDAQLPWELLHMRRVLPSGLATDAVDVGGEPWAPLWRGPETVVFGHDARSGLQRHPFAVGLDSGVCCDTGELTAYVLPQKAFVKVPGAKAPGVTTSAPQSATHGGGARRGDPTTRADIERFCLARYPDLFPTRDAVDAAIVAAVASGRVAESGRVSTCLVADGDASAVGAPLSAEDAVAVVTCALAHDGFAARAEPQWTCDLVVAALRELVQLAGEAPTRAALADHCAALWPKLMQLPYARAAIAQAVRMHRVAESDAGVFATQTLPARPAHGDVARGHSTTATTLREAEPIDVAAAAAVAVPPNRGIDTRRATSRPAFADSTHSWRAEPAPPQASRLQPHINQQVPNERTSRAYVPPCRRSENCSGATGLAEGACSVKWHGPHTR